MTSDIARRIRALLDKAENTEYSHERDAFTAKAIALMAEYQITEAMVDAAANPQDRRGRIGDREIQLGSGPYVRARLALLGHVAEVQCVSLVTRVGWDGRVAILHGYETDLARVELLYTSLLVQATSEAARIVAPQGRSTTSVRRSFLFGFSNRVGERLEKSRRDAQASFDANRSVRSDATDAPERSVALVLADRRADVDDYVRQRYGHLGTLRSSRVGIEGYGAGQAAGNRADLGSHRDLHQANKGTLLA